MPIRVLLADNEKLIRNGLCMVLSGQPGIEVVGEAADGFEAVALARQLMPDVVVMDLKMPNMDGVEATRMLTGDDFTTDPDRTVKVVALTSLGPDDVVVAVLRAGASGFVLKDAAPTDLATAIRCVDEGRAYLDPAVTRGVIAEIAAHPVAGRHTPGILDRLTAREREILELMAYGRTNEEIACQLHLAMGTVKTHVCRIINKLDAENRTQAVVAAYQNRLVVPGSARP